MSPLKKYGIRVFISLLVYIFFHVNSTLNGESLFRFGGLDRVYVIYTMIMVLSIWEIFDFTLKRLNAQSRDLSNYRNLMHLIVILTIVSIPMVLFSMWFSEYYIKPNFQNECIVYASSFHNFIMMSFQGQVLGWLIIAAELFRIYHDQAKRQERDKALMQKELLQSQYVNLKNQVNPHFLFNSFSVLQSLIDTKPDEAGKFLSRLSKMYRHILDNREESMSSVKKELEVLDLYIYLLKIRHEDSFEVTIEIGQEFHQSYIPTLSLQMLVENAVKHNQFSNREPIHVGLYVDQGYVVVKNKVKKKGAVETSTKLGLENIRSQYELQTRQSVIVTEDEQFFTVKLPILTTLRFT